MRRTLLLQASRQYFRSFLIRLFKYLFTVIRAATVVSYKNADCTDPASSLEMEFEKCQTHPWPSQSASCCPGARLACRFYVGNIKPLFQLVFILVKILVLRRKFHDDQYYNCFGIKPKVSTISPVSPGMMEKKLESLQ